MLGVDFAIMYDILGPVDSYIDARHCEAEDCMHPCYGDNQLGACYTCAFHAIRGRGRYEICDLCVLGQ